MDIVKILLVILAVDFVKSLLFMFNKKMEESALKKTAKMVETINKQYEKDHAEENKEENNEASRYD